MSLDKKQLIIERSARAWKLSDKEAERLLSLKRQKAIRLNMLKTKKATFSRIKLIGVDLQPVDWAPNCYYFEEDQLKLTTSQLFQQGYFVLQNAASFVPVLVLSPQKGDRILDICAAPGMKTTHMADLTRNKANIIANDTSKTRFFKMKKIFAAYGAKVDTILADGRKLKNQRDKVGLFDKILLDAPCSGEASININDPSSYQTWNLPKIKRLSRLQLQLLNSCFELLKPGGTIVYSTCTIAPEENELVINKFLKRHHNVMLENIFKPGLTVREGLTAYGGKVLDKSLKKCLRIIPSAKSEAFFVAKITKKTELMEADFLYNNKLVKMDKKLYHFSKGY